MKPPKKQHYNHEIRHHLSTMAPPKHGYEKEVSAHISTIKPPVHFYEKPVYEKLSEMNLPKHLPGYASGPKALASGYSPPPKDKYLPPDPKMLKLTPPLLGDFTATQPNYMQSMKPPQSSYDEGT